MTDIGKNWDLVDAVFSESTGIFDNLVRVSGLDRAADFRDRSMIGFDSPAQIYAALISLAAILEEHISKTRG